ncbi:MAG: hypothetical protein PSN34_01195 [Urechidicola sp.]|nr:hypothetical protein [Urechidicola sp.]
MKKIIFLGILFITSYCFYAQELTCSDFHNGTFIVPANDIFPFDTEIVRNENNQTETIIDIENTLGQDYKKTINVVIDWVDDCSYRAKYDPTNNELENYQKLINDNNGILTKLIKMENNCFYFTSTLNVNGEIQRVDGKMCKILD